MMPNVKIYKVCLPAIYAWPNRTIILKVAYTKEDAEEYIRTYPHPFLKLWLTIETDVVRVNETD